MNCVGVHAYGGSLTLAAKDAGFTPLAQLESDKDHYRMAVRYFGDRLLVLDPLSEWKDALHFLGHEPIHLVYGQPLWKSARVMNNQLMDENPAVDDFVMVTKKLNPQFILLAAARRAKEQIQKRLSRDLPNYSLTFVRTNALLHGLPQDKDILFVFGCNNIIQSTIIANVIEKNRPADFKDAKDVPKLWDAIAPFSLAEPAENGSKSDGRSINGFDDLISSHVIPGRKKSVLSRILWESIPLLEEGQTFDNIEERPPIFIEKGENYFQKGQLPIRFHRELPATAIYATERYIHPSLARPMTLRELAVLFGVPNNFDLGPYFGPGLTILGRFTPIPAAVWAFKIFDSASFEDTVNVDDFVPNQEFDLFSTKSRDIYSRLKKQHGKWVDAYEQKAS